MRAPSALTAIFLFPSVVLHINIRHAKRIRCRNEGSVVHATVLFLSVLLVSFFFAASSRANPFKRRAAQQRTRYLSKSIYLDIFSSTRRKRSPHHRENTNQPTEYTIPVEAADSIHFFRLNPFLKAQESTNRRRVRTVVVGEVSLRCV